ncbi:hypothetical protein GCM10023238_05390 [Streptomyces heliomycini]
MARSLEPAGTVRWSMEELSDSVELAGQRGCVTNAGVRYATGIRYAGGAGTDVLRLRGRDDVPQLPRGCGRSGPTDEGGCGCTW